MQEVNVHWGRGEMHVNLEYFLDMKNITKFRKMLKVVQSSYEPEQIEVIKNFILNNIEQFESTMQAKNRLYIGYRDKLPYATKQYEESVSYRNRFKRGTKEYKALTPDVKNKRKEMQYIKNCLSSAESQLKNIVGIKHFYEKCLETIPGK